MIVERYFSQDVLKTLDSFFSDGRRPHAVLIDGASETERLELARLVARMMVCENRGRVPCGECEHCRKAKENIHPDIITIAKPEEKKHFVKDDVKKMVADAYLTPNEADVKVFIIKEMQLMTEECQNLLLKILEEPPRYTAFILTSQTSNSIIGTVLSRVVRLRMGKTLENVYSEKASKIAEKLVDAVLSPYEFDRIEATAPMDSNKPLTAEVLVLFVAILRDAISLKNKGKVLMEDFKTCSQKLCDRMSLQKLLEMYETTEKLLRSLENSPNYTLLSTVLCAKL